MPAVDPPLQLHRLIKLFFQFASTFSLMVEFNERPHPTHGDTQHILIEILIGFLHAHVIIDESKKVVH